MDGFPVHPWLTYLFPLVYLFGFIVCCRFRPMSPHMPWLILGFGGLLAEAFPLYPTSWYSPTGFRRFLITVDPTSSVCLVVGLATVLADLRRRSPERDRASDPAPEVGSEAAT